MKINRRSLRKIILKKVVHGGFRSSNFYEKYSRVIELLTANKWFILQYETACGKE